MAHRCARLIRSHSHSYSAIDHYPKKRKSMQSYGVAHVWAQGDFVTRGIAIALLAMSLLSWSVMIAKGWSLIRLRRLAKHAERDFWHSGDFASGLDTLGASSGAPHDNPYLALALS